MFDEKCLQAAKKIHKSFQRRERNFLKEIKQLDNLIRIGNALSNIAYDFKNQAFLSNEDFLLFKKECKISQEQWDEEKEKTFKIRNKIFNNK